MDLLFGLATGDPTGHPYQPQQGASASNSEAVQFVAGSNSRSASLGRLRELEQSLAHKDALLDTARAELQKLRACKARYQPDKDISQGSSAAALQNFSLENTQTTNEHPGASQRLSMLKRIEQRKHKDQELQRLARYEKSALAFMVADKNEELQKQKEFFQEALQSKDDQLATLQSELREIKRKLKTPQHSISSTDTARSVRKECMMCHSERVNTVNIPCGHAICCKACSSNGKLEKCPVCRKAISLVNDLYY